MRGRTGRILPCQPRGRPRVVSLRGPVEFRGTTGHSLCTQGPRFRNFECFTVGERVKMLPVIINNSRSMMFSLQS